MKHFSLDLKKNYIYFEKILKSIFQDIFYLLLKLSLFFAQINMTNNKSKTNIFYKKKKYVGYRMNEKKIEILFTIYL